MYKFIVVDDEHLIRKGILKKIEALDLKLQFVGEADNGQDALELIKASNPDIVLTDMRMPLMDGKMLLRKLQEDFPNIKIIVISGYSDFEYLQEAISAQAADYILKPFNREEIRKALKKAMDCIDKELYTNRKIEAIEAENEQISYISDLKYLSDLIVDQQADYDSCYLKSRKTSLIKTCNCYALVSIYCPRNNSEALYQKLLSSSIQSDNILFIPGPANQNICFLLYTFNKIQNFNAICSIKLKAYEICDYLQSADFEDFYLGISLVKTNLSIIHEAYLDTISSLEKRDLHSFERVCFYENGDIVPCDLCWNNMEKLIFSIESGNIIKVNQLLEDFFSKIKLLSPLNLITVKYNCQLIYNKVTNMLKSYYDIINNYSLSSKYEKIMNNMFDFAVIKKEFQQLIISITSLLKEKNIYPSDQIISNIKKYIQKNYSLDINLEKISELFFISPSYCCYLFKEKTGENFSDYINNIRIEKAKDFLSNTDYKVYKIAKMLGYENDKYFFRIFKKFTGYTPEKFRENFSKDVVCNKNVNI